MARIRSVEPQLLALKLLHAVRGHEVRLAARFPIDGGPFREAWCRDCLGHFALDVKRKRLFPWSALFEAHRDQALAEQQRKRAERTPRMTVHYDAPGMETLARSIEQAAQSAWLTGGR